MTSPSYGRLRLIPSLFPWCPCSSGLVPPLVLSHTVFPHPPLYSSPTVPHPAPALELSILSRPAARPVPHLTPTHQFGKPTNETQQMKQVGPKTTPHGPVKQNVKIYEDKLCNLLVELGKSLLLQSCVWEDHVIGLAHASSKLEIRSSLTFLVSLTLSSGTSR